ncbi:alpha/beta hydrolase family protein [Skermania piniformis]
MDELTPTRSSLFIDSPAMQRIVEVQVLHPAGGGSRPSLYLLDGIDSGADQNMWTMKTDVVQFFADKDVNVVLPVGGHATYYTDWQSHDPTLGLNRWETFLTEELPPLIDRQSNGNGTNAIAGLSMGGQAALTLASRHRNLYRGVGAFSACPDTRTPTARSFIRASVAAKGGNADNMWGTDANPDWAANDPITNAANLRGLAIYQSVGNGIPGPRDTLETATSLIGPLEVGANACTRTFDQRLQSLGIPAKFVYRPVGTHSWGYWQDDLHDSWSTLGPAIGR